jgi:hypothetical protein
VCSSDLLKKYCECYQSGVLCGKKCACDGCKNCGPDGKKDEDEDEEIEVSEQHPMPASLIRASFDDHINIEEDEMMNAEESKKDNVKQEEEDAEMMSEDKIVH